MEEKKCYVCDGTKPTGLFAYRCEIHEVCDSCGIGRKKLKEPPWGTTTGFICQPCENARRKRAIKDFEDTEVDNWDFQMRDDVKCVYCGYEFQPDDFYETGNMECPNCDSKIHVEVEYDPYYTITKPE